MTKEEAIATLQNCAWLGTDKKVGQVEEAIQMAVEVLENIQSAQSEKVNEQIKWERDIAVQQLQALGYGLGEKIRKDNDTISRAAAIEELWKALYEYEDKMEKQFLESDDLDVDDWFQHRIFVQNMSDIDRRVIIDLPSVQPEDYAELKQEFLRMASYIDVLLECSDEQKETLIGFISRLAEFMPWTERD